MSLDVYLEDEDGNTLFTANITHNLGELAKEAGIYDCLWRPGENGISVASEVTKPLALGLAKLTTEKSKFEAFNASNGWGKWEHFVPWCAPICKHVEIFPVHA